MLTIVQLSNTLHVGDGSTGIACSERHTMKEKIVTVCVIMALIGTCLVSCTDESDAAYAGFGEIYVIDLAPGFKYTYTPTYPDDLDVVTTIHMCEQGVTATVKNGTVTIQVKDSVLTGSYDVILKAYTDTDGVPQTAYQHIRINVVKGLSVSGSINNIVLGTTLDFTPTGTSGMGDVQWSVKEGTSLPDGLSLIDGKVVGSPTTVGLKTLNLVGSCKGETKDLTIRFTVYNVILDNDDEVVFSHGNNVSSTPITQTGNDLKVTWRLSSGTLPEGFSLNTHNGVVSGRSTVYQSTTVTILGCTDTSIEPYQEITKDITIRSEPDITMYGGPSSTDSVYTYVGAGDRTIDMSIDDGTSPVTWSVSGLEGVSIDQNGVVTYSDETPTGTFIVSVSSEYGQVESKSISIISEVEGIISGNDMLAARAGAANSTTVTCNLNGTWSISGDLPDGVSLEISQNGKITLSSADVVDPFTADVVLTTLGGQVIVKEMTFKVINSLVFKNTPTNGVIAYEV